jgi:hypothetical protein
MVIFNQRLYTWIFVEIIMILSIFTDSITLGIQRLSSYYLLNCKNKLKVTLWSFLHHVLFFQKIRLENWKIYYIGCINEGLKFSWSRKSISEWFSTTAIKYYYVISSLHFRHLIKSFCFMLYSFEFLNMSSASSFFCDLIFRNLQNRAKRQNECLPSSFCIIKILTKNIFKIKFILCQKTN